MKYINKFDSIVENVAQARSILNRKQVGYDNPVYQEILHNTKRDGYTGFITKIVFDYEIDKDDAIEIYFKVKKDLADVGELNKMSKEEVEGILTHEENEKGYEYIFTENHYKIFKVDTYEGIMNIGSPAWCLKTKSNWDNYTKDKRGMQFVVIQERFVPRDSILLTVPKDHDGSRYESGSYAKMRFGVTVYPSGRMDIFDDSNVEFTYNRGLSNDRYSFILPVIFKIAEWHRKNFTPNSTVTWEEYDQMKDTITDIMHSFRFNSSFSQIGVSNYDIDEDMDEFYEKVREETGMNKQALLKSMNNFREQILSDDFFIAESGYMDILVNEFLTANGEDALPTVSNVTARKHPLGGYFFDEQEPGDLVIKYGYGYQHTKYGVAGILQGFGSVTNFYKEIADNFIDFMTDDNYAAFDIFDWQDVSKIKGGRKTGMNAFKELLTDTLKNEPFEDGFQVFIDIPKVLEILEKYEIGYTTYDVETHKHGKQSFTDEDKLVEQMIKQISYSFTGVDYDKEEKKLIVPIYTRK